MGRPRPRCPSLAVAGRRRHGRSRRSAASDRYGRPSAVGIRHPGSEQCPADGSHPVLRQLLRQRQRPPSEARHLLRERAVPVELQLPSVARKSPVADFDDMPLRRLFETNKEVDAATVFAVDVATAEDHLDFTLRDARLVGSEAKGDQDGVEGRGAQVKSRISLLTQRLDAETRAYGHPLSPVEVASIHGAAPLCRSTAWERWDAAPKRVDPSSDSPATQRRVDGTHTGRPSVPYRRRPPSP